ncbi:MAG: helix-turn-helix domain-containing protein [Thiolinea sp.]
METFCEQLRFWRKNKGFSQLDLSLEAGISSKHISFLETARAKPSKEMVLLLADALDVPLRHRNQLLSCAGFAEHYERTPVHQDKMQNVQFALNSMLEKHEPYPAMVLDWNWNIVLANQSFQRFLQQVQALSPGFTASDNVAEMLFDPQGAKPFIRNWDEVASVIIQRLHHEKTAHPGRHTELLETLFSYPDTPQHWRQINLRQQPEPMVYVDFELAGNVLKFFTTLTSFGTPIDITAQELVIEQYYPADEATRQLFESQVV